MAIDRNVVLPDAQHPVAVELKLFDSNAADLAPRQDAQAIGRPDEVFLPTHLAWVKKQDFVSGRGVDNSLFVGLVAVAMKTSQRQVFQSITASLGGGQNVVNREGNQLPMLVGVTVLAQERARCRTRSRTGAEILRGKVVL